MGIGIVAWRVAIGLFVQPNKQRSRMRGLKVPISLCRKGLQWILFLSLLLAVSGDIELNPGPRVRGNNDNCSQPTTGHSDVATGTRSRQRTLSSYASQPQTDGRRDSVGLPRQNQDMFDFLRGMKSDLDSQNAKVTRDISQVNTKIDAISDSITCLRAENEKLKSENQALRLEMAGLRGQFDKLEGYSRRNNLRINGIPGCINEKWSDSENTVRNFIKNDLNLPDKENVEIERAHRVKSRDPARCTIVVKLNKFKDRECIIERAKTQLSRDSNISVKPDYTDRVVRHRRELGRRMLDERQKNNYATISYDKLIVNDQIYKYDDITSSIVCIGRRQYTRQPRGNAHGHHVNNNNRRHTDRDTVSGLDDFDHVGADDVEMDGAQASDWTAHGTEGVVD